jgi:hypothetical protein
LTAGTNTNVVDATQLGAGSQEIRANGARSGDNNFMLNGVDSNSDGANMTEATPNSGGGLPIPARDTIQEFKVQTSLYNVDTAIIKRTRLGDRASFLIFRWEFFNFFNHPKLANPASYVSGPATFGKITAMSVNPRIMQYGLKGGF